MHIREPALREWAEWIIKLNAERLTRNAYIKEKPFAFAKGFSFLVWRMCNGGKCENGEIE